MDTAGGGEQHINGASVAVSPAVAAPSDAAPDEVAADGGGVPADVVTGAATAPAEIVPGGGAPPVAPGPDGPPAPAESGPDGHAPPVEVVAGGGARWPDDEPRRRPWPRRILAVVVVLVAAFAVVVLWARPAHEPPPRAAGPGSSGSLNATDLAFLQLMIALDGSALPLFDLMQDSPALRELAGTGRDGHTAELAALRAALSAGGGVEDATLHAGQDLPGMVLPDDLDAVRTAPAEQRAAKAVAVLREHLSGTVTFATAEGRSGTDPATKAAALQVLDAHTRLLGSLPAV